jgi:hypothetical protein
VALLEHTGRRAGSAEARAEAQRSAEAYKQTHPTELAIVLHGTLGIVSYEPDTRSGPQRARRRRVRVRGPALARGVLAAQRGRVTVSQARPSIGVADLDDGAGGPDPGTRRNVCDGAAWA